MALLSLERILIDGLLFSLAFAVIVVGSLAYNARLWIQDYPA
ncbi:MAG: nitroreductase, partial [Anaerolinea sp.]|nr:nitroreductase [Anaerolinea sp.]